jgi:hypothetical protein
MFSCCWGNSICCGIDANLKETADFENNVQWLYDQWLRSDIWKWQYWGSWNTWNFRKQVRQSSVLYWIEGLIDYFEQENVLFSKDFRLRTAIRNYVVTVRIIHCFELPVLVLPFITVDNRWLLCIRFIWILGAVFGKINTDCCYKVNSWLLYLGILHTSSSSISILKW